MRLDILNSGYSVGRKVMFAVIRSVWGHRVPDAAKLVFYRPDFYGGLAKEFTQRKYANNPLKPPSLHSNVPASCFHFEIVASLFIC